MHRLEPTTWSSPSRARSLPVSGLFVLLGLVSVVGCSAEEAKEAVMRELAIGSWLCASDVDGARNQPFTIHVEDGGTFRVPTDADPGASVAADEREIRGTWSVEDGDLEWGVDGLAMDRTVVEDFDALTLESPGFTLLHAGIFKANDGSDGQIGEQDVLVDTNGTDSVTLRVPDGDPWTCDRQ